ncbi:FAD-dependent oxidoreductase [Pseudomonas sp. R5(2019)]|uniref:FAD-dependent oxidoreductase n=1 Tax=Pseudomonas sp. R5(2019) TaxID=2697566 RepID=UPI0014132F30|nr:FAD-dependent oxidoreductase [Pseudomonas sp. R5(2019)]NBA97437.1 FAD-dependent oxidoreductase [Pseudomonas sp. R5(2019)]
MTLHAVARLDELSDDRATRVDLNGVAIVLVRQGAQVQAFQADCPHQGAPLEEGAVCEGRLICPWHKAMFNLEDGQLCEPPALKNLRRYPVRIIDSCVWLDDEALAQAPPAKVDDQRNLVVIGAGAAGSAAIATLHQRGFAGRLVWIDQEPHPAYDRTSLSKFVIAGQMPDAEIPALLDDSVYQMPGLERVHARVHWVDHQARQIHLADGQSLAYDAALLATGAVPQRPDIEGAELPGAFVLRSRSDAATLLDAAVPGARAVIIGDSFIGLEAASALRKRGLEVQVVARHAVPLSRQLGEQIGAALQALHQQRGVVFHRPTEPLRLIGESRVEEVELANGVRLAADLVLFGTGVKPATDLLKGLELADDHCVKVDDQFRAAPGLWAAGDIVTFPLAGRPQHIEHWRVAQQQARLAALNMLGETLAFEAVPFFWTYHYGKTLEVLGHARQWNHIVYEGDLQAWAFIALLCVDEQVESVVACKYSRTMALLAQRMKRPLSREEALVLIHSAT